MGMVAILIYGPWPFVYFQPLFNRLHMEFEEIWPRGSEEKSLKGEDGQRDDGRGVITIAQLSAQVS